MNVTLYPISVTNFPKNVTFKQENKNKFIHLQRRKQKQTKDKQKTQLGSVYFFMFLYVT